MAPIFLVVDRMNDIQDSIIMKLFRLRGVGGLPDNFPIQQKAGLFLETFEIQHLVTLKANGLSSLT